MFNNPLYRQLSRNKGILFIVKFLLFFGIIYGFHLFFIGITSPSGSVYSSFLQRHLNYINWWRTFILKMSEVIASVLGVNSHIEFPFVLRSEKGPGVRMVYSCIGYGVTSFWMAFVLANEGTWKRKLIWIAVGCGGILVVNSFRVALLLMAVEQQWKFNKFMDHHTMFNIAAYALIFLLIYLFTRQPSKAPVHNQL